MKNGITGRRTSQKPEVSREDKPEARSQKPEEKAKPENGSQKPEESKTKAGPHPAPSEAAAG
jgi:hypothetical protein